MRDDGFLRIQVLAPHHFLSYQFDLFTIYVAISLFFISLEVTPLRFVTEA